MNKIKKGKNNFEEPMLSKKPINCASCNREILHTKLTQPDHIHYNSYSSTAFTPRQTGYGSLYSGSIHSNIDNYKVSEKPFSGSSNSTRKVIDYKNKTDANWNWKPYKDNSIDKDRKREK